MNFLPLNSIGNFFGRFRQALRIVNAGSGFVNYIQKGTPIIEPSDNLITLYENCPALNTIIGRGAEMFSNGDFKVVDKDGNEMPDHELTKFFRQPNPLETLEEWLYTYFVLRSIFGKTYIYQNVPTKISAPTALWHIAPDKIEIIPTGKLLDQYELKGIIDHYLLCENGNQKRILMTDDIIFQKHGVGTNPLKPESKLISLLLPISNINGAYKALNIASYKGAKVILTSEGGNGAFPLNKDERERVEKEYDSKYGLADNQTSVIITNATLKANIVSFPTKDLLLLEQIKDNFNEICYAFGIDKNIFDNSTFENKQKGERATYQNTISPAADELVNIINKNFAGALLNGQKAVIDYTYLPVMQEDAEKLERSDKVRFDKFNGLYLAGIISPDAFAEFMKIKLTGDGKIKGNSESALGKIPLALQQIGLAVERANANGDSALANSLLTLMDELSQQIVTTNQNGN